MGSCRHLDICIGAIHFSFCAVIQCFQLFLYLNNQDKGFSCAYQVYSLLGLTGSCSIGRTAVADMRRICRTSVRQHCHSHKCPLFNSTTLHFDYSKRFSTSLRAIAFAMVQQEQQNLKKLRGSKGPASSALPHSTLSVEIPSSLIEWPRENYLFLKQFTFLWIQFQIGILKLITDHL